MHKHQKVFTRLLLFAAVAMLALAAAVTPHVAGLLLAADGTLDNPATIAELQQVRLALAAAGALLALTRVPLVRFLARHPNALALGVGSILTLGLVGVAELALAIRCHKNEAASILRTADGREPVVIPDAVLGYKPLPSSVIHARRVLGHRTIFDATYSQDAQGRRIVPAAGPLSSHPRVALFFGCSFTYGEGVMDDQTMPYQYARFAGDTRAINLAYNGYGPQNMLAVLADDGTRQDLAREVGPTPARVDFIYTFIDHHVKRAEGALSVMHYGKDLPAYRLAGAGVERVGTFASARPVVTPLLRALSLSRVVASTGIDWPVGVSTADLELTVRIIAEAKAKALAAFPGSRFHVLLYPQVRLADQILPLLKAQGLDVLDYSREAFGWDPATMAIPVDLHPSAKGHEYVASHLADDLNHAAISH